MHSMVHLGQVQTRNLIRINIYLPSCPVSGHYPTQLPGVDLGLNGKKNSNLEMSFFRKTVP